MTDDDADHLAKNLSVFETFLAEVEDGAELILNKVQGVGHGGSVQLAAGTDGFADMERFLGMLGADVGPLAITPATLFDGVKLESWRSTLRRAAIVFAGRVPTDEEYAAIRGATGNEFRAAIRGLMEGPGFHEFLIRAGNDRLLTDRDANRDLLDVKFVEHANTLYALGKAAIESGYAGKAQRELETYQRAFPYGVGRAPLELIAHVAANDLPYTEVLTADYIMANPQAARAYGVETAFVDDGDVHDFQPSEVASYYRDDESKVIEEDPVLGHRVIDPGDLATDYPHAGILNTTAFLSRYPSTATNRNRARSRWTYYHFLGLDIEKSASRTTDPAALADTNNPTMHNPACTVCHTAMDPVAGAFQNYGDEGWYRDRWGGLDSLDDFYKDGTAPQVVEVEAESYESRETVSAAVRLSPAGILAVQFVNDYWDDDTGADRNLFVDRLVVREEEDGEAIFTVELEDLTEADLGEGDCGLAAHDTHFGFYAGCRLRFDVGVPIAAPYVVEVVAWADQYGDELAQLSFSEILYRDGDTWYRDMRQPGFDGHPVPDADDSLPWLARRIVADDRFAEAAVRFWWPALMGGEVVGPPEEGGDADFEGQLLAANAHAAEVQRLARGFRRGFRGGPAYNLKELLVEMVISRWFRAESLSDDDPVRAVALRHAGARRLLTPEELARKTLALTGFQWGRRKAGSDRWRWLHEGRSSLTSTGDGYGLLYGGIDSAGVTERATDITSVMAGVAQSHAVQSSCPIVMKELYLLPKGQRRLFERMEVIVTPTHEFGDDFEVEAASWTERETLTVAGHVAAGNSTVTLSFLNNEAGADPVDRNIRADRLDVIAADGRLVQRHELEELAGANCGDWGFNGADENRDTGDRDHFAFYCNGSLDVPVTIAVDGTYEFAVVVWADQNPSELAKLRVAVGSDAERSAGSRRIKAHLVDLYRRLFDVAMTTDSPQIVRAYDLFVDVWQRRRESGSSEFFGWDENIDCDWTSDHHYLDGIVENAFVWRDDWDWGEGYAWNWDRINSQFGTIDWSDPEAVAETWTVVLAYLLMDYRYLYL